MKKLVILMAFLLMVAPALAISMPLPIVGQVLYSDGTAASGIDVTIKNMNSGESITTKTASDGYYLFDWANSVSKYRDGDKFSISVQGSTIEKVYAGSIDISADFTLGGAPVTPPVTCPPATVCPVCQTCDKVECVCPVPVEEYNWTTFMTGGALIAFMAFLATAFAAYKGKIRIQKYEKYLNSKGAWSTRWKTLFQRAD